MDRCQYRHDGGLVMGDPNPTRTSLTPASIAQNDDTKDYGVIVLACAEPMDPCELMAPILPNVLMVEPSSSADPKTSPTSAMQAVKKVEVLAMAPERIPIRTALIGGVEVNSVSARGLHKFLEVGNDFSTWMKEQIKRARLLEHRDFEVFLDNQGNPTGGRPRTAYILTIDAAKHIAMMAGKEKGFEVRDYFIEMERMALAHRQSVSATNAINPTELKSTLDRITKIYEQGVVESMTARQIHASQHDVLIRQMSQVIHMQDVLIARLDKTTSNTQHPATLRYNSSVDNYHNRTLTEVATLLGINPNLLCKTLREMKVFYTEDNMDLIWVIACPRYSCKSRPYFSHESTGQYKNRQGVMVKFCQTLVTPLGIRWLFGLRLKGKFDAILKYCPDSAAAPEPEVADVSDLILPITKEEPYASISNLADEYL